MAYERVNWKPGVAGGTPISASNLNVLDQGISDAVSALDQLAQRIDGIEASGGGDPEALAEIQSSIEEIRSQLGTVDQEDILSRLAPEMTQRAILGRLFSIEINTASFPSATQSALAEIAEALGRTVRKDDAGFIVGLNPAEPATPEA